MIPVSVIITTRNEAPRLARCLMALRDFAEIIVVDSASMDGTAAIAVEHGAVVHNFIWNGQYPKKRQYCLDHLPTQHDWIFFVDADEIVTPELVREIRALRFDRSGYFVAGAYVWQGKQLRHGLKNNKLALLHRHYWAYPVVDDLGIGGMGEMEGHYQPNLIPARAYEKPGQLKNALRHDAAQDETVWLDRHRRYAVWERGMNARDAWPVDPVPARQRLKKLFRAMPARGLIAFLHCYLWRKGFLDGAAGFDFACKRAAYYRMIASGNDFYAADHTASS